MKTFSKILLSTSCFFILGCKAFVPSDANKSFVSSYNELLKSYEDFTKNANVPKDCRYWMKPFTYSSKDFNTFPDGDSVSLFSSFNDLDTTNYFNSFITPLIDDSYVVVDNNKPAKNHIIFRDSLDFYCKLNPVNCTPLNLYTNTFSTNCTPLINVESSFKFPKKNYRSFNNVEGHLLVIFVPIDVYRNSLLKRYDETDFVTFSKIAIDPREMKEIQPPKIEKKSSFWGSSNLRDQNKYSDSFSITGTICNVIKKGGSLIPCYIFSQDSFRETFNYIKWKKEDWCWNVFF